MDSMRTTARALTAANLAVGITGFLSPFVTQNDERGINVRPGLLYGVFAMNWAHALLHLSTGIAGLPAWSDRQRARRYLRLHVVLYGALAAYAWPKVLGPGRIHMVMGMALDAQGNAVQMLWAAAGLRSLRE